ncbi:MAG: hypothetical protein HYX44_00250 [Aquabacterium sp.]|nr:hypothetical protein [Aquabacterium sp.]
MPPSPFAMLRRRRHAIHALVVLASLTGAQAAQAVVLDFEDLICARTQPTCHVGSVYASKGYTLRYAAAPDDDHPVGFQAIGKLWTPDAGGSTAMLANSCNASTVLTAQSGKPFSVLALDLAEANADAPVTVEFIGTKTDGTQVRMNAPLDGKPGWQRVVFPSAFYNLKTLTWLQGDCISNKSHMFDNILVMPGIAPR